jgi:hypothetical protein
MTKKLIQLNPSFFNVSKNKTLKKNSKSASSKGLNVLHNQTLIKPDKVKKQLMFKIKEFQKKQMQRQKEKEQQIHNESSRMESIQVPIKNIEQESQESQESQEPQEPQTTREFHDEFMQSLNFLQDLSKSKQEKREKIKPTLKHSNIQKPRTQSLQSQQQPSQSQSQSQINISTTPTSIQQNNKQKQTRRKSSVDKKASSAISANLPIIHITTNQDDIHSNTSNTYSTRYSSKTKEEPPFSILKGGSKPTYREWIRQTQKNTTQIPNSNSNTNSIQISASNNIHTNQPLLTSISNALHSLEDNELKQSTSEREDQLKYIKKQFKEKMNSQKTQSKLQKRLETIKMKRQIRTIKHKLGKSGKRVSILIKNHETRKRVQKEKTQLQRQTITDMKRYLQERNIIKVGTSAPSHIIRKMYEECVLAGDVENKNKSIFIHNFIHPS